jgi:predicted N-acetyltransferase YhbS
MSFGFSLLDDSQVEAAFAVLQRVGRWNRSQGRHQRISNMTLAVYQQWQSEHANHIVTEGNQIVGLVTLRRESLDDWPDYALLGKVLMLRGLATDPEHRHRGVGAFAVRRAVQLGDEREDIYLDCVSNFLPDYYETLGFEKIDRQILSDPIDDGLDITLMRYRRTGD